MCTSSHLQLRLRGQGFPPLGCCQLCLQLAPLLSRRRLLGSQPSVQLSSNPGLLLQQGQLLQGYSLQSCKALGLLCQKPCARMGCCGGCQAAEDSSSTGCDNVCTCTGLECAQAAEDSRCAALQSGLTWSSALKGTGGAFACDCECSTACRQAAHWCHHSQPSGNAPLAPCCPHKLAVMSTLNRLAQIWGLLHPCSRLCRLLRLPLFEAA